MHLGRQPSVGKDSFYRLFERDVGITRAFDVAPQDVQSVAHFVDEDDAVLLFLSSEGRSFPAKLQLLPSSRVAAVASDEKCGNAQLPGEIRHRVALGSVDPVRPHVDAILGVNTAACSISSLKDDNLPTRVNQGSSRGKTGESCTDDDSFAVLVNHASLTTRHSGSRRRQTHVWMRLRRDPSS